jgi:hypothetical protein
MSYPRVGDSSRLLTVDPLPDPHRPLKTTLLISYS